MAQILLSNTTDLTCQSCTDLPHWPLPTPKRPKSQLFPYMTELLPRSLLSMKLIKYEVTYHFLQHNIRQKLLVFSLKFKDIITVTLDL